MAFNWELGLLLLISNNHFLNLTKPKILCLDVSDVLWQYLNKEILQGLKRRSWVSFQLVTSVPCLPPVSAVIDPPNLLRTFVGQSG